MSAVKEIQLFQIGTKREPCNAQCCLSQVTQVANSNYKSTWVCRKPRRAIGKIIGKINLGGGKLIEFLNIEQGAQLSLAAGLLASAQQEGQLCAWISRKDSHPYPADLSACGVNLASLPIVQAQNFRSQLRALERLLRSGAFSQVVLDHGGRQAFPLAVQGRLAALAKKHCCTVITICQKKAGEASMGPMVSLCAVVSREEKHDGGYRIVIQPQKDKGRGIDWNYSEDAYAPIGMY